MNEIILHCLINPPFVQLLATMGERTISGVPRSRDVEVGTLPVAIFFTPYFCFLGFGHRDATAKREGRQQSQTSCSQCSKAGS